MIYLDNNATTKIDDRVLEAMLPYLKEDYGNASSTQHKMGRNANHAIESARSKICEALHIDTKELIFTSGATEAINLALKGIAQRYKSIGKHIITCATEHKAVLQVGKQLEKNGFRITYLSVDGKGNINLEELKNEITDQTILVAIMYANNETGVIHPIVDIANLCKEREVLFFCDATQYVGKENTINLQEIPIDLLCFSSHKFHGPKGIGALYIRRKRKPIQLETLITGGNQEQGIRGGTYPVANIVGLGTAVDISRKHNTTTIKSLRDYLENRLCEEVEEVWINGNTTQRLSNTSNITIKHVKSAELMMRLPSIALSSGSACVTGSNSPSHVLKAMGIDDNDIYCSLRISLSHLTTKEEIDETVIQMKQAIQKIRSSSPIWQMYKEGLLD